MSGLPGSRQRTMKIHRAEDLIVTSEIRLSIKRSTRSRRIRSIGVESELGLTVRESQSQGFGASLDVREGGKRPKPFARRSRGSASGCDRPRLRRSRLPQEPARSARTLPPGCSVRRRSCSPTGCSLKWGVRRKPAAVYRLCGWAFSTQRSARSRTLLDSSDDAFLS